jgi:hypothetical protein
MSMGEANTNAPQQKKRGVGFPQLSLEASVEAIVAIGQHGPSHTLDAAAAYMGHSTANSGAFRNKCASFRDFALITRGDKDRFILTELAQELVLAAPDHARARPLLLTAFESCRVFAMLYHDSAKDLPQDLQRFRTTIVMRHGVASDQADKFLDSFVESVVYVGLGKFDGNRIVLFPRDTAFDPAGRSDDLPDDEPSNQFITADSSPVMEQVWGAQQLQRRLEAEREPAIPVALRQTWPIDGGEIEFAIRTPKAMPPAIYALMAKMAEVAAEMETLLRPEPTTNITSFKFTLPAHDSTPPLGE